MTLISNIVILSVILMLSLAVAGCGGAPSGLSGVVTYEGKPIERGYITFFPANGVGNTLGADIVNGEYHFACRPSGDVRILVASHPRVEAQPARANGPKVKLVSYDAVPANAIGNNQIREITADMQTLTIELRKAATP
jgi:hypothetical protein